MKLQEEDYYGKYWQLKSDKSKKINDELVKGIERLCSSDPIFEELPVWGTIERELQKRVVFFREGIKGKILDAGCGSGEWVFHLANLNEVDKVVGVDISKTAIKGCIKRKKIQKNPVKAQFVVGTLTNLPFDKKSFNSIFCLEVAEHVLDVNSMLAEFNRILKKGGYLGISTVDFNLLKMIIIGTFFFEKYFDPRSPHIRFFTKKTLGMLLEKNGFELKKYRWTKSYFGIMPMGQMVLAQKIKDI